MVAERVQHAMPIRSTIHVVSCIRQETPGNPPNLLERRTNLLDFSENLTNFFSVNFQTWHGLIGFYFRLTRVCFSESTLTLGHSSATTP